jgi:hypothetical protein
MVPSVTRTVDPGPNDSMDEPTERWLDGLDRALDNLRYGFLPRDFPFDYSAASLDLLEPLIAAGRPPDGDVVADDFMRGALSYVGESLMRVGGGVWRWSDGPVVSFDPELGFPDLPLAESDSFSRTHAELAAAVAARPGWEPTKLWTLADPIGDPPVSAQLESWLWRQEAAFARWPGGPWDFSPRSVEALEKALLSTVPEGEGTDPDAGHPAVEAAAWYFGESLIRNGGGRWVFTPGEPTAYDLTAGRPVVYPSDPDRSLVVPTFLVAAVLQQRAAGQLSWWGG